MRLWRRPFESFRSFARVCVYWFLGDSANRAVRLHAGYLLTWRRCWVLPSNSWATENATDIWSAQPTLDGVLLIGSQLILNPATWDSSPQISRFGTTVLPAYLTFLSPFSRWKPSEREPENMRIAGKSTSSPITDYLMFWIVLGSEIHGFRSAFEQRYVGARRLERRSRGSKCRSLMKPSKILFLVQTTDVLVDWRPSSTANTTQLPLTAAKLEWTGVMS